MKRCGDVTEQNISSGTSLSLSQKTQNKTMEIAASGILKGAGIMCEIKMQMKNYPKARKGEIEAIKDTRGQIDMINSAVDPNRC